jgi:hypothetical protein
MTEVSDARNQTLARLAESRAEIRRVLDPPRPEPSASPTGAMDEEASDQGFPRSRTMRLLLSGRGLGTVGAMVGGLVLARPALALKLLRILPTGAVARLLIIKAISALRSRDR